MSVALALPAAGSIRPILFLLAAAGLLAWFVLLGLLAVATRPRLPAAGPAVLELTGEEPPAVANFLVNGWRVTESAPAATLLDLAARGIVDIDEVGPDDFLVRLRGSGPTGLTPYETQVYDLLRREATNGVVPCAALDTGNADQAKAWWKSFEKSVVADARDRGLARPRWSGWQRTLLGVTALVPAVLIAAAFLALPDGQSSSSDDNPIGAFFGIAAVAFIALMGLVESMRAWRETPDGRTAAAGWLGLRSCLERDETFPKLTPAAVAIWDRLLAYGVGLGVAVGAAHAIPLGAESLYHAWSPYGGRWHEVRIRYPHRLRWGGRPVWVFLEGLLWTLALGWFALKLLPTVAGVLFRLPADIANAGTETGLAVFVTVILAGVVATLTLGIARGLYLVYAGGRDLGRRVDVVGRVLRVRVIRGENNAVVRRHLAVDPGGTDHVRAWIAPASMPALKEGDVVRVRLSPQLRHIDAVEPLPAAS